MLGDVVPDRRRPGAYPALASGGTAPNADTSGQADVTMDGNSRENANDETRSLLRRAVTSNVSKTALSQLRRGADLVKVPKCVTSRMAVAWAETVEGSLEDDDEWARFGALPHAASSGGYTTRG